VGGAEVLDGEAKDSCSFCALVDRLSSDCAARSLNVQAASQQQLAVRSVLNLKDAGWFLPFSIFPFDILA